MPLLTKCRRLLPALGKAGAARQARHRDTHAHTVTDAHTHSESHTRPLTLTLAVPDARWACPAHALLLSRNTWRGPSRPAWSPAGRGVSVTYGRTDGRACRQLPVFTLTSSWDHTSLSLTGKHPAGRPRLRGAACLWVRARVLPNLIAPRYLVGAVWALCFQGCGIFPSASSPQLSTSKPTLPSGPNG